MSGVRRARSPLLALDAPKLRDWLESKRGKVSPRATVKQLVRAAEKELGLYVTTRMLQRAMVCWGFEDMLEEVRAAAQGQRLIARGEAGHATVCSTIDKLIGVLSEFAVSVGSDEFAEKFDELRISQGTGNGT